MEATLPRRLQVVPLGIVLAVTGTGLAGCADDEDPPAGTAVELPDIRGEEDIADPYVGALNENFRDDLEAYARVEVTLLATVEEVLSSRTFTVTAPDGSDVEPVLVVVADSAAGAEPEVGEDWIIAATPLEDFDARVVAEELGIGLTTDRYEEWDDGTFLVATVLEEAE